MAQQHHYQRRALPAAGYRRRPEARLAAVFGQGDVLVHNVDILSDVDFSAVERHHKAEKNLVTLCVSARQTKRLLLFGEDGRLKGRAASNGVRVLAFSGISVVSPELFDLLPEAKEPYPIIDEYIRLANAGYRIGCYEHSPEHWLDVGKPEAIEKAKGYGFKV